MKGSMRQRGPGSWQLRVFVGRDPVTARKRWATKTIRGGKREAQRALAAMIAEVDRGVPGTDATLAVLLERWFEVASPDWAPGTVTQTRSAIRHHLGPRLGSIPLRRLRPADIDACYAAMRKLPGRKGEFMSPAAIRRVHVVLHAALAQAVKWGWIPTNPADAASPPRVVPPDLAPPPAAGVARLLAAVASSDPELFAYLRLAVSTGARRSQLCGLQWRDVDLSSGALTFARAVVDGPSGIIVKATKTHRSYRVTVDASTLEVLRAHHGRMTERAELCSVALRHDGFAFSFSPDGSRPGGPMSPASAGGGRVIEPGSTAFASTTCATSWPRRCSPPACRCRWSPAGSATPGRPRRSTCTPTSSIPATRWRPTCCSRSWRRRLRSEGAGDLTSRARHPKKEVEEVLRWAEERGWSVLPTASGHRWGEMRCTHSGRDGCRISVWSTPKNPGNHARRLRDRVRNCPHTSANGD